MPIPEILKSTSLWSGVGVVGIGGTGITAWQIWEYNNPTGEFLETL